MKKTLIIIIVFITMVFSQDTIIENDYKKNIIPIFMTLNGIAIATMWTVDIYHNDLLKDGFFKSKEGGKLFWPHLIAEYGTAAGLIVSAYGLYNDKDWANSASLFTFGALAYTSLSSMSWALADKSRYIYAVPMIISLTGIGISIGVVF